LPVEVATTHLKTIPRVADATPLAMEDSRMALTNRDRVGKALEHLKAGLRPFVERELRRVYADRWEEIAREGEPPARSRKPSASFDSHALLAIMWRQWEPVFKLCLGRAERSLVNELQDVRNRHAHEEPFSSTDAYRALDSVERLLCAVSAPEAAEVGQMRMDLMRVQFEEQRRGEMRKASFAPTEGKPQGGLKPWREVATPHPDVASGRYHLPERGRRRVPPPHRVLPPHLSHRRPPPPAHPGPSPPRRQGR
jgi:hypothetical protein